ncbi:hypothetical protein [uncultured Parabacteroides sp.]|uniref:hypothetical protein n=2 Tax=uncultured Parabacteroides sp. TaxID=512312 RepID=UPI002804C4B6|nr:hypothetical protein [uncultured Parabacteroides sp.]
MDRNMRMKTDKPTKEELITRLKEIARDDIIVHVPQRSAMCYSPCATPWIEHTCDICGQSAEMSGWSRDYELINQHVQEMNELGYQAESRDICPECMKKQILSNSYDTKDLSPVYWSNMYRAFYFRTAESEPYHIALSSDLNSYRAVLYYLKDNRFYSSDHGDMELLRDNIKCIEKMTGIHISEGMQEGKTPEQLIGELEESLSEKKQWESIREQNKQKYNEEDDLPF